MAFGRPGMLWRRWLDDKWQSSGTLSEAVAFPEWLCYETSAFTPQLAYKGAEEHDTVNK